VATSGCFDLLHAGHVEMLNKAAELGQCLIVCLNSDESVSRLKGEGRPIVTEADRAAVLKAFDCVDAVHVFTEDTPERVLTEIRPDFFVKGDEYRARHIPESGIVERFGGEVVLVPQMADRSTTSLIETVLHRQRSQG
jgi:rfaE bifunctional protein nucleotidyltransferase chain/domain